MFHQLKVTLKIGIQIHLFCPMQKFNLFLIFFTICIGSVFSQDSSSSVQNTLPMLRFNYAYQFPAGDLQERFGNNSNVGVSFSLLNKHNFQFGIQGEAIFDGSVHEPGLLGDIMNDNGMLTNAEGQQTLITKEERGLAFFLTAGKLLKLSKNNQSGSGLLFEIGLGYLQHKIKLDYRDGEIYQLTEELMKGYDRLSSGLAIRQSIGYQFLGKRNLVNFYLGFEITEAFTKSQRGFNYDTMEYDKQSRLDVYVGARAGWIIPFRKRKADSYYYY